MIVDKVIDYTTDLGMHNNILLNMWGIVEFSFYFFVLREIIVNMKVKKRIFYIIIVYAVFALVNLFFIQHNDLFNPINFTIGTVITVILCIYYFFELFQKTEAQSLIEAYPVFGLYRPSFLMWYSYFPYLHSSVLWIS